MRFRTLGGRDVTLPDAAVRTFRDRMRGQTIDPEHPDYGERRAVWNGMIDRHPALIARCSGVTDVMHAVRFAREHQLLVAVRGGGHNVAGTAVCDGGIVIDLSTMRAVWVNPRERTARVQGGALWGDVDHETQAHGLATTGGVVSHTGVAGLTLGGGIGWLMRRHGLTVDNLLSADVVTADGGFVRASGDEHPDLFWALRGGGGNFGVVTSFEFALHSVGPTVLAGPVFWAAEEAADALRFYRDWVREAPDDLGTVLRFGTIHPLPVVSRELHWRPALAINAIYAGPVETGQAVLRPLREHGTPLVDLVSTRPYMAHQSALDGTVPHGWHYYWKSTDLPELSDDLITVLSHHAFSAASPRSYSVLFHLGGAVNRVGDEETAYSGRHATHNLNVNGVWRPGEEGEFAEADVDWVREFFEALEPYRDGVYVNFLDSDDGATRVREAYGDRYDRLVELKTRWDPTNLFRVNQNIEPRRT